MDTADQLKQLAKEASAIRLQAKQMADQAATNSRQSRQDKRAEQSRPRR